MQYLDANGAVRESLKRLITALRCANICLSQPIRAILRKQLVDRNDLGICIAPWPRLMEEVADRHRSMCMTEQKAHIHCLAVSLLCTAHRGYMPCSATSQRSGLGSHGTLLSIWTWLLPSAPTCFMHR